VLEFPGVIVVWSGDKPRLETHRIPLTPSGFAFGREQLSETTDDRISRQHVMFSIEDKKLVVNDMGSRNGTFVDGETLVEQARPAFPAIVRAGRTLLAVVPDIRHYEGVPIVRRDGGVIGPTLHRAYREIDDAARCEENVIIEAAPSIGKPLAQRYCKAIGGHHVVFEPDVKGPDLETFLTDTRPRTIVLVLTASALGMADMRTVTTWLETDVRFVIVQWPNSTPLSWMKETSYERLRSRVVDGLNPRFDELPTILEDIVRSAFPAVHIHPNVVELVLLRARRYDEAWLIERFREAVRRCAERGVDLLRAADVAGDLEPPRNPNNCLVGT
jgi:pSer/pThr/pTyr-binding forkhead associated (FHA) protein